MKTTNRIPFVIFLLILFFFASITPPVQAAGEAAPTSSIVVDTNADNTTTDGSCTLREAITNANNNLATYPDCTAGSGTDTITFAANYTISLGSSLPDVKDVVGGSNGLTITGNGTANTIIQASTCDPINLPGGCTPATYRIIKIDGSSSIQSATFENMTFRYGGDASGAGINNQAATLTLNNMIVTNNKIPSSSGLNGGGLSLNGGNTTINNSAIRNNSVGSANNTTNGNGGGIFVNTGSLNISNSTISGNTAYNSGGGIYAKNGSIVTINNSTISGNTASNTSEITAGGGGIAQTGTGTVTLNNVTLSGNSAVSNGAGLFINGGTLNVTYSTIANNKADNNSDATGDGGGVYLSAGTLNLASSIVAGNKKATSTDNDCSGTVTSLGYNLTGTGVCTGLTAGTGDVTVAPSTVFTSVLSSLAYNGGSTSTHGLLVGGAAVDVIPNGTNDCGTTVTTDQRGETRPFNSNCDMGAYEYIVNDPPIAANEVYTTTEDIPLTITAPGVLGNDSDPDGDILEATLSALPSHGTVILNSDGSFVYTPTADYDGTDTFAYLAYDGLPLTTIAYWPFDDQTDPTADESGNGHNGTLVNGPVFSTDVPITYTGSTASLQFDGVDDRVDTAGSISLANNSFTVAFWAKRTSLSGNSDFAVGLGTSTTTNNYLHIGFRDTNIFTCAFWNNDLNTSVAYTDLDWHHWACVYDADTNFRAIYRDGVMVASDTATADFQGTGTLTMGSRGTGDNFTGALDEVRVYDLSLPISEITNIMTMPPGMGAADNASVTLNITSVNDAPIAVDDTYTTTRETPLISPLFEDSLTTLFAQNNGQSGNMFDVTAGPKDLVITSFDANLDAGAETVEVYYKVGSYVGSAQVPGNWTLLGTANVVGQGPNNVTPVPIGGLTIPAGQTYGIYFTLSTGSQINYTNGTNTYSDAYLTISAGTGNGYPFGTVISSRTWNGTIYYEINDGVLQNDSDAESQSLTTALDTAPTHGILSLNSDGSFVYTPTLMFCGLDTFTYYANDGELNSNLATTGITVSCLPNDPPVATNDAYTTTEDIPLTVIVPGILGNDTDPDGDVLEAALLALPAHGTVQLNTDGSFVYTPTADYNGTDSFSYLAYDGLPLPAIAHWPFDDQTNPTADESGNGHNGTLVNGPVFSTDVPPAYSSSTNSLQFDGVDDRMDAAGTISLANNSFTVAFWAKRPTLTGNSDFVVGLGTSGTTNNYLHIGFRDTNIFTCAFWDNDLNTSVAYTDLDWHHWACVYDADTNYRAIYRDGVLIASDIAPADFQGTGTFTVGSRGTGDHFAGNLDEVRVYALALPASEITNVMTIPPGTGEADSATVVLNITSVNDAPIAVDDAYTTPQGTPLVPPPVDGNLTTTFASNNGQDGNMFNVTAGPRDIHITGFDINVNTTGPIEIAVYYKEGTYAGSEQNPNAWTHLGMFTVNAQGQNNPTFLDINSAGGITIPAGELYGLYLSVTNIALSFRYTNGAITYSNADLTYTSGTGNPYPFGIPVPSRNWNGTIYYEMNKGVLANDSDAETLALTSILETSPNHGTLSFNSNGSFVYTPTASFIGVDTFTYIASDGTLTDTATVSITVTVVLCLVETTGDSVTDYASADESALQNAINNASPGDTLKVAGTCAGTHLQGGETQTIYISQTLTIQGGYTSTNWLAAPDPIANPTVLDALEGGRVAYVPSGVQVTLDSLTLKGASSTGDGGGIHSQGTLTVTNSLLTENSAQNGSGIYNNGTLTVDTVTFTQNDSTNNGTIANFGWVSVQNSTFYSNTVVRGGGIYVDQTGDLLVANSTFAYNTAGEGGGIHNRGTMTLTNSTFAYNTANVGSGVHNWGGTFALYNNIMAYNNVGSQCHNSGGTLNASINNLMTDGSCNATFFDDPLLAPLGDNGGSTWTFMLQEFSPAIDAGDNATCEPTDQRGVTRPVDAACDIGAVEMETNFVPVAVSDAYTTTEDTTLNPSAPGVLANDLDGDRDTLTAVLDTNVSNGTLTLNADGSFTYAPDDNYCGADNFTYHAEDESETSNTVTVNLTITCINDDPVADDDTHTVARNSSDNTFDVRNGDSDVDGDDFMVVAVGTPDQGGQVVNNGVDVSYTPATNFAGTEVFTYTIGDGNGGFDTAIVTVTVTTAPVVDAGSDQAVDEGTSVDFSGNYTVFPPQSVEISWDFGDSATATGTLTPAHTYEDNGTFTVTLTITGTDGTGTDSLVVSVLNVAPALDPLADQNTETGSLISFATNFTDPGTLDTHAAMVDWGDGTVEAGMVNAGMVSGSHTFTSAGVFIVTVTLTDDDGGTSEQTFTVTITEPKPTGFQVFLPVIVR